MPWVHELMAGTGRKRMFGRTYLVNHNGIGSWDGGASAVNVVLQFCLV